MTQSTPPSKGSGEFRLITSADKSSASQFFVRVKSRDQIEDSQPVTAEGAEPPPTHRLVLFAVEAGYFLDWSYGLEPCDPSTREGQAIRRRHLQSLDRRRLHMINALMSEADRGQAKWIDWLEPGTWHYLEFGQSGAPAVLRTHPSEALRRATSYVSYVGPVTGAESWELTDVFSAQSIQAIA